MKEIGINWALVILYVILLALTAWAAINQNPGAFLGVIVLVILPIAYREDIRASIRKFKGRSQ